MFRTVFIAVTITATVVGLASAKSPFTPIPPTVPRPPGDHVPQAASVLEISWTSHQRSILVTNKHRLLLVARAIDELPEEGPGTCAEGFIEGPPTITFTFRGSTNGPALAQAVLAAHQGYEVAWCIPTRFRVDDNRAIRLEGAGYLLKQAGQILRRNLGS